MRTLRLPTFAYPYQMVIWSSFVSNTGTTFYRMAAAIVAFRLTGQVAAAGGAYLFSLLPRLILLPIGGAIGDRVDRRDLLIRLDLVSIVAAGLMILVTSSPWLPLMYTCGFVLTSLNCIYKPSQQAYLRQLAGEDQITHAITNFTLFSLKGSECAGPLIATPLVAFAGATTGFIANAASFAISAALLAQLPAGPRSNKTGKSIRQIVRGYIEILRDYPRVRAICIGGIAPFVPLFYFMGSAVAYATHLGQPSSFMTVLVGALAVGGFVGGLWAKHGQKHGYLTGTVAGTVTIVSIPMWALLSFTSAIWLAVGVIFVIQVFAVATEIVLDVLAQHTVPDHLQGRLITLIMLSHSTGQVAGAFIVTRISTTQAVGGLLPVSLASVIPLAIAACIWVRAPGAEANAHALALRR